MQSSGYGQQNLFLKSAATKKSVASHKKLPNQSVSLAMQSKKVVLAAQQSANKSKSGKVGSGV